MKYLEELSICGSETDEVLFGWESTLDVEALKWSEITFIFPRPSSMKQQINVLQDSAKQI